MQNKRSIVANRIVVKVGTSTLIRQNSKINLTVIKDLAHVLSNLKNLAKTSS
jgi:Glutamate 5-kinase